MLHSEKIAVVGAGVIGCAVAHALTQPQRNVVVFDRAEPGCGGASYGNAGHIATELIQPLASPRLLNRFWRELFVWGGTLDIPLRRIGTFAPWGRQFVSATARYAENLPHLTALIRPATAAYKQLLRELGRLDLLRAHGHYHLWLGRGADRKAERDAQDMARLAVRTEPAPNGLLSALARAAGAHAIAGLWFPDSAHVLDPLEVVRALAKGAIERGANFRCAEVRALGARGSGIEVITESGTEFFDTVVVCAGAWSALLLAPFGMRIPLEAAHGYHVELAAHVPYVDAPLVYVDRNIVVTPMSGRLRASSFMEFSGLESQPDLRKPARLQRHLRSFGYQCSPNTPSWRGARSVLPDGLPGIGRAPGAQRLFYNIGHHMVGLTMAPLAAQFMAELVAEQPTTFNRTVFDLRRFGTRVHSAQ